MDHNCSFVYEASPLVVWPDKKTSARCFRSRWCSTSSPSPLLFDDGGLNNEEKNIVWDQRISPSKTMRAKKKNHLFENGSEDELNQAVKVSSCTITTQTSLCKKNSKDASTSMDKSPAEEVLDAYLSEHPFLDLIGSCGGIMILVLLLYYVYRWYRETVLCC
ncbi:unnamed protein product [Cylicocyclus nassatus]|uniref:Uncharacterized protein n=1 Tax=Cylicocyclus nassatus TaxID=53992 RepID=A0AA36DSN3_CYLNA|nr:unnamed protein product [Cylicocyclus nassatus]